MPDVTIRIAAPANIAQASWLMAKVDENHPTQVLGVGQDDVGFTIQVTTPDPEHLLEFLRSIGEITDAHPESPTMMSIVMDA